MNYLIINKEYFNITCNISKHLQNKIIEFVVNKFPNKESKISFKVNFKSNMTLFLLQNFYPYPNDKIIETILICQNIKAKQINLIAPYFPYSRQDKKNESYFNAVLNLLSNYFANIITIDIHNPLNLPKNVINLSPVEIFAQKIFSLYSKEEIILISPDHGSINRAKNLAQILQCPYFIASKVRTTKGSKIQKIKLEILENINNKICIIIDDIIESGQTMYLVSQILKDKFPKFIDVFATHGSFNGLKLKHLTFINKIYVTNTINSKIRNKKINILAYDKLIIDFLSNYNNYLT